MKNQDKRTITPLLIIAQFLGTSLWFVGNISIPQLPIPQAANPASIANALAAVQIGFITGTLVYAVSLLADRHSPSRVFAVSAALAASCNLGLIISDISFLYLLVLRFLTGFFLAGIYPVGMKIAADYYETNLGKALGYLVGALVLGTAFPHFLDSLSLNLDYYKITYITSFLAFTGGLLVLCFIPDGPFRKRQNHFQWNAFKTLFDKKSFRNAAFGYFGHMWELYAFWVYIPILIVYYNQQTSADLNAAFWSFTCIALGALSCAIGGHLSIKLGSSYVARNALKISGICCLLSPFVFWFSTVLFLAYLLIWGAAVVADSPQFSRLVAANAPAETRGSALTIVNCLGYAVSVFSIHFLSLLIDWLPSPGSFIILAIGPAIGLWKMSSY